MLLNNTPLSLYVHLPWCETQCPYCDFSITTDPVDGNDARLAEAIIKDIKHSSDLIADRKFKSIYFGGGTPSLASTQSIKQILDSVRDRLTPSETEITIEMNPNDVSEKKVEELLGAGINRVSLGIQSYIDQELQALGRNHDRKSAIQATNILKDINSTIDLIYGIEKQTPESLAENLEIIIASNVNHLSLYQLTIEPNTIFYKKELKTPKDTEIEKMESSAKILLNRSNFYQYEVSSWTKNQAFSKHNMNYWMYGDFLGLGPGAHSKITSKNSITRMVKLKQVNSYIKNPTKVSKNKISSDGYDIDLAMNILRLKDGITFDQLAKRNINLTESFLQKLEYGIASNLLEKNEIKATDIGYKFLNDTVNIFS